MTGNKFLISAASFLTFVNVWRGMPLINDESEA